jgi:exonuclease SbcC
MESSVQARRRAAKAWLDAGQDDAEPDALDRRADDLAGEVGAFKVALAAEQQLQALREQRSAAAGILAGADAELAILDARRAELPKLAAALSAGIAESGVRADARPEAARRVAEARARVTAAEEAAACRLAVIDAQSHVATAGRALTRASAELDELRDRRFRDHAGELAELLAVDEPCPVCGSCEHPAPASRGDDPITDERIAEAEAARNAAMASDSEASAVLRAAEQSLADAVARAAGQDVAAAEAELAACEGVERLAVKAAEERVRLEGERDRLEAETALLAATHTELASGRAAAANAIAGLDHAIASSEQTISVARGGHESVAARIAEAEHVIALARALAAAQRSVEAHRTAADEAAGDLADRLGGSPFADEYEAVAALRDPDARGRLDAGLRRHEAELALQKQTLLELELEMLPEAPVDVEGAAGALLRAAGEWRAAVAVHTEAARLAAQLDEACEAARIAHESIAELAEEADVIERLANSVAGRAPNTLKMNLETFVLAAELEEIVASANVRLDEMSQGRYRLQHTDSRAARGAASGLGIEVLDAYTGHARPVQSLSGGETFLASLALALGLAEVVTARAGGIRLDTLFIDEGFGSLDADTLDIAMRTLDELRQGGRVIGVISHVEAMKDQLPAQLLVQATDQGPSVIRQDTAIPV